MGTRLDPEDFEEVSIETGNMEESEIEKYNLEKAGDYQYIKMKFTEEKVQKVIENIGETMEEAEDARVYFDSSNSEGAISEGDGYNTIADFKVRLDSLEIPYAFGTDKRDDKSIVIKAYQKDMNEISGYTLGVNEVSIENVWKSISISNQDITDVEISKNETGNFDLKFELSKSAVEEINQKFDENDLEQGMEFYLGIGDYRIAKCVLTEPVLDEKIIFEEACLKNQSEITEDNRRLYEYVKTVCCDTEIPNPYYLKDLAAVGKDNVLKESVDLTENVVQPDYSRNEELEAAVMRMRLSLPGIVI